MGFGSWRFKSSRPHLAFGRLEYHLPVGTLTSIETGEDVELHGADAAKRQAQIGLGAVLVLLITLVLVALYAAHRLYTAGESNYLRQAAPLRAQTKDLTAQFTEQDTLVRRYLFSAPFFQENYRSFVTARQNAKNDLVAIAAGVKTHPELAPDIALVRTQAAALLRFYDAQIALIQGGTAGRKEANTHVYSGATILELTRTATTELVTHIDSIVANDRSRQRQTYKRTAVFLVATGSLAAAIGLALLLFLPRRLQGMYQREQEARARAELGARSARALAHVDDAVILLDELDQVAYWNQGAESLLGPAGGAALGQPIAAVLNEFPAVAHAAGEPNTLVPLMVDGEERWFAISQTTFAEGRVFVLRDATEAQALERARDDFVTTAAHELRTPITAIFGAAQTLRRTDIGLTAETAEEFHNIIESESARLNHLVEQILTTAQLDRGELRLAADQCDLRAACESVLRAHELAKPDGVTLTLDAAQVTAPLDVDDGRLRQVLSNLVGNAIKYSPQGGTIEMHVNDGAERVRIDVRDEGIGIPASERKRIFDKFYRLDPALTRGIGGTGLGLYISRQLVEQMGGTITVTSRPGAGSTFSVELPRRH